MSDLRKGSRARAAALLAAITASAGRPRRLREAMAEGAEQYRQVVADSLGGEPFTAESLAVEAGNLMRVLEDDTGESIVGAACELAGVALYIAEREAMAMVKENEPQESER